MRLASSAILFACACAFAFAAHAQSAPATSGWNIQARVIPNPLPDGRCAGISVEVHDQDGYRVNALSNGDAADSRRFVYSNSNTAAFSWKDGDSTQAMVCAKNDAPDLSQTTIGVTTPDGLHDQVEVTSAAPGKSRPAVIYASQHPLRLPGSPPKYVAPGSAGTVAVAASPASSGPSAAAAPVSHPVSRVPAAAPSGAGHLPTASYVPAPISITSGTLVGSGIWWAPPPVTVTAGALVGDGGWWLPPPVSVTTPTLGATGNASVSLVARRPSDDAPFVPAPVVVTAPVLEAEGTVFVPGNIIVTAPSLSASGYYYIPPNVQITTPTMQAVGPP